MNANVFIASFAASDAARYFASVLRWMCTPEVSTSVRLLLCRIWNSIRLLTFDCPHNWRSLSRCNRLRLSLCSVRIECRRLLCISMRSVDIVHKCTDDSYGVSNVRPCRDHRVHKGADCRCIRYRLHIFSLSTGCRTVSLRQPKINGERGRSRFGRLHVEAF